MAIYRYQSGSLLDYAQVLTNETGGKRAYLHAAHGASSEQLRKIKLALREKDYMCIPTVHGGEPVLEVRGFQKSEELLEAINSLGLVQGAAVVSPDAGDARTRKDKAKNHPLQMAGYSYFIGDMSYLAYTVMEWWGGRHKVAEKGFFNHHFFDKLHIAAGVGYALGNFAIMKYGGRDQSQHFIETANKKMYGYLRKEDVGVDDGSTLHASMHEPERGFVKNVLHTVSRYPSETLNSVYIFVGAAIAASSIYHATRPIGEELTKANNILRQKRPYEWLDVGLGAVTATSALAGITIKEKKPIEGEPKRHGLAGVADWIQEKPLRATGYGFMVATLCHAIATVAKYNIDKDPFVRKTVSLRGVFVATNILSEILIARSSKGHGIGVKPDSSVNQTVIASTAELILRQPGEEREGMIQKFAGYMSSREVLDGKADDIAQAMRVYVAALEKNPWTKHYVRSLEDMKKADAPSPEAKEAITAAMPSTKVHGAAHLSTVVANDNELKPGVAM